MKKILIAAQSRQLAGMDRQYTTATIADMVYAAGALPITGHFSNIQNRADGEKIAEEYIATLLPDGIILQGGEDIPQCFYNTEHEHLTATQRDYFELGLIATAFKRSVPLFGICRGMQLINVVLGGTLIPDLETENFAPHIILKDPTLGMVVENSLMHSHKVELLPGGILARWYRKTEIEVTSFHHQAVNKLAYPLKLEALSIDGVVEAFSDVQNKTIGVQWHPEVAKDNTVDHTVLSEWIRWL